MKIASKTGSQKKKCKNRNNKKLPRRRRSRRGACGTSATRGPLPPPPPAAAAAVDGRRRPRTPKNESGWRGREECAAPTASFGAREAAIQTSFWDRFRPRCNFFRRQQGRRAIHRNAMRGGRFESIRVGQVGRNSTVEVGFWDSINNAPTHRDTVSKHRSILAVTGVAPVCSAPPKNTWIA